MSYIDTRDLIETRDELKQEILDSFLENFPHYEEITDQLRELNINDEDLF